MARTSRTEPLPRVGLNKSILDAGWGQFVSILAAKAEEAGRRVVSVNPAYTSTDCHVCGERCLRPHAAHSSSALFTAAWTPT